MPGVFVDGLPYRFGEAEIAALVNRVPGVRVQRVEQRVPGCCDVQVATLAEARQIVAALNRATLEGRWLKVELSSVVGRDVSAHLREETRRR